MKHFTILMLCAALVLITGCMGYQAGSLLPEHIKTISVPVFTNSTSEPNIETQASNAVLDQLNIDGTLEVVNTNADAELICDLVSFERRPLRYGDGRPNEYRITITVVATLTDLRTGKPIWSQKRIRGRNDFLVQGNLPAAEREAIPEALEDLAHDIVEQVVEGWQ